MSAIRGLQHDGNASTHDATTTEAAPEIMAPPTVSGYSRHVCSPAKQTRRLTGSASWSYVFPLAPTGMNEYDPVKGRRHGCAMCYESIR